MLRENFTVLYGKIRKSQFLQDTVLKEINIFLFVPILRTVCTDMWLERKVRDVSESNIVAFFDIHALFFTSDDRVTEITGKVKVDKPVGRDKLIHVVV